jgi:hypothetical protein
LGANETFVRDGDAASFAGEAFRGQLEPDITYVALRVDANTLRSAPDGPGGLHGWYISLAQPADEPRFGLDDNPAAAPASNAVGRPDSWSWQGLPGGDQIAFLSPGDVVSADNPAVVARNLFQKPFRLLLRANDYIPAQRDR